MITRVCSRCKRILPATKEFFRGDRSKKLGLEYACKECIGSHFGMPRENAPKADVPEGMKQCAKCGRIMPLTNVYFERKEHGKWKQDCLECRGGTFRPWLREPAEGMRVCRQCYEEYPETEEYFENTSGHLRVVCRKCRGVPYRPPEPAVPDGYKRCSKCGKIKPDAEEYFSNHASRNICRECSGVQYMPQRKRNPGVPAGMRKCDKCGRVLPRTSEHFKKLKETGWFANSCRECNGDPPVGERLQSKRQTGDPEGMKTCTKCGRMLPATAEYFYSNHSKGLHAQCIECSGYKFRIGITEAPPKGGAQAGLPDHMRKCVVCGEVLPKTDEYFYSTDREYKGRRWLQWSSYCKQCSSNRSAEWIANNYDRMMVTRDKYRVAHREELNERARKDWAIRWAGNTRSVSTQAWEECKAYFGNRCAYCGKEAKTLTRDHVVPVKMGGRYQVDNIVPACKSCNSSKGAKQFREWYRGMPFYSEAREFKIMVYMSNASNFGFQTPAAT